MTAYKLGMDGLWEALSAALQETRKAGVYRLHISAENGDFRPLPRLLGEDPHGILYIGTSGAVPDRVASLKKSVSAAYRKNDPARYAHLNYVDISAHQAGKKIAHIPRIVETFPFDHLYVTVEPYISRNVENDIADYGYVDLEEKLLRDYEGLYGEKPALNA